MMKLIVIIFGLFIKNPVKSATIIWDNSVTDFDSVSQDLRAEFVRMPNHFFIFPGTKWCGAGNIAEDENDLGSERDTDKCCRNHDFCPDFIEGYGTKYNLTNPSFYTRLNCKCDKEFRQCLKSVNTKTSAQVGHIYFTALGTQCYKKEYPIVSCKKQLYFPRRKCVRYEFDTEKEKVYQWFDIPNF